VGGEEKGYPARLGSARRGEERRGEEGRGESAATRSTRPDAGTNPTLPTPRHPPHASPYLPHPTTRLHRPLQCHPRPCGAQEQPGMGPLYSPPLSLSLLPSPPVHSSPSTTTSMISNTQTPLQPPPTRSHANIPRCYAKFVACRGPRAARQPAATTALPVPAPPRPADGPL